MFLCVYVCYLSLVLSNLILIFSSYFLLLKFTELPGCVSFKHGKFCSLFLQLTFYSPHSLFSLLGTLVVHILDGLTLSHSSLIFCLFHCNFSVSMWIASLAVSPTLLLSSVMSSLLLKSLSALSNYLIFYL
jgi:hypothetical protein